MRRPPSIPPSDMAESHENIREGIAVSGSRPLPRHIRFEWMRFNSPVEAGAGAILEWDMFGSALLAITFTEGNRRWVDGSAVLIGPGIALAARHVFEPVLERLESGELTVDAISILPGGLMIWRIRQIVMGQTDVAILRLDLESDLPEGALRFATLTTRSPAAGERVMIVGTRGTVPTTDEGLLSLDVRLAVGRIAEVHANGRDKFMLPHPSIAVSCLTLGGMSGGPAFDQNGNVLGILTSSFEDDEGPSYVSLWWPSVASKIETFWLGGLVRLPANLLDLERQRMVAIDRPNALHVTQGDPIKIVYEHWA